MSGQRSHWINVTGQVRTDATYFHGQNISGKTVPRIGGNRSLLGDSRHAVLAKEKSAGEGGGLWCKSTICGLNGHRVNFVMALSLETYGQAI